VSVSRIEQSSFGDPWSLKSFLRTLESDIFDFFVCEDESGEAVGYIIGCAVMPECEIANIAVDPAKRRMGIGRFLLESYIELMESRGADTFFLEVRRSNIPAIALYTSLRFKPSGIRKKYYKNPVEDALLMTRRTER